VVTKGHKKKTKKEARGQKKKENPVGVQLGNKHDEEEKESGQEKRTTEAAQ